MLYKVETIATFKSVYYVETADQETAKALVLGGSVEEDDSQQLFLGELVSDICSLEG